MRVGESLEAAWRTFKQHIAALVAATFALMIAQIVVQALLARVANPFLSGLLSMLVGGLVMGGQMNVARIAARGQEPTLADAFKPCTERQGDYLIVGLAVGIGVVLCFVGVFVTSYLFLFSPLLVVEGKDFKTALRESVDLTSTRLGDLLGLFIVILGLNVLGAITLIGWLVTLPVSSLMLVHAYEQMRMRSLPGGEIASPTP